MADINLGVGGANSATGVYDIDNSLKFEADNSEYLSRTPSSAGNRKTWTLSCWVKRTELTADSNSAGNQHMILSAGDTYIQFDGNAIWVNFRTSSVNYFLATNRLFRDTSAWYHIVLVCDTTESTASNRAKLYINGVQETSLQNSTYSNMSQNYDTGINNSVEHEVGKYTLHETTYANFFCGYIAEMHLVDGTALAPTDFGETDDSGIWKPKQYTGSHGTNGFYLDFEDSSSLGADASANSNNFSLTNIAAADQATDTPTNNFCTLNPLSAGGNRGNVITEGATKVVIENNGQQVAVGTIAVSSGKWYWEAKHTSGTYQVAGIISADSRVSGNGAVADSSVAGSDAIGFYRPNGYVYYNGTGTTFDTNSYSNGDIVGVALDMDNGTCALYKNGSIMGNVSGTDIVARSGHASLTGDWTAFYSDGTNGNYDITYEVNFGGYQSYTISSGNSDANGYGNFEYAPPSGYYALCSKNLAEYG